jgi:dipeptide/tripeptide permease
MGVDVADVAAFAAALVPFLNSGMIIVIIDLVLRRMGVEISSREFKRRPWESLALAFGLIAVSNVLYLVVQERFAVVHPLLVLVLLLALYVVVVSSLPARRRR